MLFRSRHLHHFERLIQQHLARQPVVHDLDVPAIKSSARPDSTATSENSPICERESSSIRVLDHGNAVSESEFEDDAAAKSVGDVVVPEREVALREGRGVSGRSACEAQCEVRAKQRKSSKRSTGFAGAEPEHATSCSQGGSASYRQARSTSGISATSIR